MQFARQEYWSGLPFPSPGNLPNPGIEPRSPELQADSLPSEPPGKPCSSAKRSTLSVSPREQGTSWAQTSTWVCPTPPVEPYRLLFQDLLVAGNQHPLQPSQKLPHAPPLKHPPRALPPPSWSICSQHLFPLEATSPISEAEDVMPPWVPAPCSIFARCVIGRRRQVDRGCMVRRAGPWQPPAQQRGLRRNKAVGGEIGLMVGTEPVPHFSHVTPVLASWLPLY